MARLKRKGTAAKSVDSDIHNDQDNVLSSHNSSQKDTKVMEQMTSVKKSKPDETQTQGKTVTDTTQVSKQERSNKDGNKGTNSTKIAFKSQNKNRNGLEESCNDIKDDAHSEK